MDEWIGLHTSPTHIMVALYPGSSLCACVIIDDLCTHKTKRGESLVRTQAGKDSSLIHSFCLLAAYFMQR